MFSILTDNRHGHHPIRRAILQTIRADHQRWHMAGVVLLHVRRQDSLLKAGAMNRIATIFASLALAATPVVITSPADATVGTGGLTCTAPVISQTTIDEHGPYTQVAGVCTDGPADTTWRMRVRFETVFGTYYTKTYGWADYGDPGRVVSTRIGDEVFSVVYQWGDAVVPTRVALSGSHALPPTGLVLSHVEGSNPAGWYVEATRYQIPVFLTFPKLSVVKAQTCDGDALCISLWRSFYADLAAFRDAEQPAPVAPLVLHHHSGPVAR